MGNDQPTLKAGFQQKVQRAQASPLPSLTATDQGFLSLSVRDPEGGCAWVLGLAGLSSPHILCVDSLLF